MENVMIRTGTTIGKFFEDKFCFVTTDKDGYLEALHSYGADRYSEILPITSLRFEPMPDAILIPEMCGYDEAKTAIAIDSANSGTNVRLKMDGESLMLRDTALISIYERLKIAGQALSKLSPEKHAKHLNDYADVAGSDGRIIMNNGKVEAVMGKNYRLVPAEQVMETVADFFDDEGAEFRNGFICHQSTTGEWSMGTRKIEIPIDTGLNEVEFNQTVMVRTSDCGFSGINILPIMSGTNDMHGLRYSLPVKMEHVGDADLNKLSRNLKLISRQFDTAEQTVMRLADISLSYPVNVLLAMLKWLKIPAKYGVPIYEKKKMQWGDDYQSAFTIYSSLSEVLSLIMAEEKSLRNLAEYQERFARALEFRFEFFDLPGEYSYTDKIIGQKGV